jgi:DNA-binding transcriptional LysR family regulator
MLNLRQIEAFNAVMQTGSVSRAAKRLFISQPAVSKLIQNLEYAIDILLFDRTPGKVTPTAEACLLFEEVERVFRGLISLDAFAEEIRTLDRGRLRVGVMPALSTGFIQDILVGFTAAHPLTRVTIHARSTAKLVDWLVAGHLEVGVSAHPVSHPEIHQIPLCRHNYICILPPGHPLADKDRLSIADLAAERFIAFSTGSDVSQRIEQLFIDAGIERRIVFEASMAPTVCAMVARGLGVAIVNPHYLVAFASLVVVRPIAPTVDSEIRLLLPAPRRQSLVSKAFIEQARTFVGVPVS